MKLERLMVLVGVSLTSISVPLCAQAVYYLPQVIDGATAGGSLRSTIVLTNPSTSTATVNVVLTRDDGSPLTVNFPDLNSGSRFSVTLKPNGTRILQTDGSSDGSAGAATVSANVPIGVAGIVSAYDASANLVSESGTGNSMAGSAYVIPVDSTLGMKTGVGLFNPNATSSALTFTLFDINGTMVEMTIATLEAGGHLSRPVAGDLFPDLSSFRGTMVVASTLPVAAVTFRQNASAPSYTLLEAEAQTALPLWHYFPQLADGQSVTTTLQSSFFLYNLSKNQATVTLTFSQDSGVPWVVNMTGLGANNTFTVKLAAGGSAFLQTDGQGVSTAGAARITSDQPVGTTAVVTATDGKGKFLSEAGMGESQAEESFLLAVDTTNNRNTGAAFFNPASQPVTLHINLLDTDGNLVTSTQSQPLAPGARLAAYVSDWFPGTSGMLGTISIAAGDGVGAGVVALALRQNSTPLAVASIPVAPLPFTGIAINVTPVLDNARKATAMITPDGGSLSLADANGNKFGLTIPANALTNSVLVTMTPVTLLSGLPAGGTFNAGVQLEPDGLMLFQPAQLTIEPASAPAPGTTIPLGWHGTGQGVYLNLVKPQSGILTLMLTHFSGAGIGTGTDGYVTSQLLSSPNAMDRQQSRVGFFGNKPLAEDPGRNAYVQNAGDIIAQAYVDVQHFMELAIQSNNDEVLRCASAYALNFDRQRQILGYNPTGDSDNISQAITTFAQDASRIVKQHARERCLATHDPLAGVDLFGLNREAQLEGLANDSQAVPATGDVEEVKAQCSPNPVLSFQSEISETAQFTISGPGTSVHTDLTFDAQLSAKVTLTGTPPGSLLIPDSGKDHYISFQLTGSAPLTYDTLTAKYVTTATNESGPVVCTGSLTVNKASTLTVQPKSEIRYQYTPKFRPQDVFGGDRKLLASFCPVYDKSPVSVTLLLDPGMPMENFSPICTGGVPAPESTTSFWQQGWTVFHPSGSTISGWQIPGSNSFAHKEFSLSMTTSDVRGTGSASEKTKLDLNQPVKQP